MAAHLTFTACAIMASHRACSAIFLALSLPVFFSCSSNNQFVTCEYRDRVPLMHIFVFTKNVENTCVINRPPQNPVIATHPRVHHGLVAIDTTPPRVVYSFLARLSACHRFAKQKQNIRARVTVAN
uniref:(northern house mosquito) hypothetical protein n=1 Tax=Culex pipiens TaxID=7175 RepID=A0A8D8ESY6_CULPI